MSKTALSIGEIIGAIVLTIITHGAAGETIAEAWGMSATATSTLFAMGVSVGITGAFGLMQSLLNPQDTSVPGSQANAQDSAAFRRVVYGAMTVGGVLTYDSAPSGNKPGTFANQGPANDWRHQIYTLAGHEITAFGRNGIVMVIIDGIETALTNVGGAAPLWVPADYFNPYGGIDGSWLIGDYHIAFEFDLGSPIQTTVFPALGESCPDWGPTCLQKGCAKVHVMMRYDASADGSHVGNGDPGEGISGDLQTYVPIYVSGRVPSFRFPVVGKPLADPRVVNGNPTQWAPNTEYAYADYILDPHGDVEWEWNGPGDLFESGTVEPNFQAPGVFTADNRVAWLNAGPLVAGGWPGPTKTIQYPYTFTDPNGNLQTLNEAAVNEVTLEMTTGASEPTFATQQGQWTPDGGGDVVYGLTAVQIVNPGSFGQDGVYNLYPIVPPDGVENAPASIDVTVSGGKVALAVVNFAGSGFSGPGSFNLEDGFDFGPPNGLGYPPGFPADVTLVGVVGAVELVAQVWLCLGVPQGNTLAANPSNCALAVYDYLINTDYGLSVDPSDIDIDSVSAAANICEEEAVIYAGQSGRTITERLYDCNGVFDYGAARGDVLKSLLSAMAGTVVPPGDMWHIFAGSFNPPTVTLTDDDLRGAIKADFRISRADICNGVKGSIIPSHIPTNTTEAQPEAWRWTDFPPYQGNGLQGHPDYLTEDGGQDIWKDIRLGFVTSLYAAQRLAKIVLQTLRFQTTLHLPCKLTAFRVRAGDTVTFVHTRWAGLTPPAPTTFFVTQAVLTVDSIDGTPALGVDLVLRETSADVYTFTPPSSPTNQGEYSQYGTLGTLGG